MNHCDNCKPTRIDGPETVCTYPDCPRHSQDTQWEKEALKIFQAIASSAAMKDIVWRKDAEQLLIGFISKVAESARVEGRINAGFDAANLLSTERTRLATAVEGELIGWGSCTKHPTADNNCTDCVERHTINRTAKAAADLIRHSPNK